MSRARASGDVPRQIAHRPWTARERRIVWRGLTGRFAIAIEPLLGMLVFALLTWGIVWRAHHSSERDIVVLAPIFAFASLAFAGYFVAVLYAPVRAYLQTYEPIFILDGYLRYRGPDLRSQDHASGYVAVLFPDKSLAQEWEFLGDRPLPELTIPALAEYSVYGGIHKIDGTPTGVLPDADLPLLAIGIARHR